MGWNGSLPCRQKPSTISCFEPREFTQQLPPHFHKFCFNIIFSSTRDLQSSFYLSLFQPNFRTHLSCPNACYVLFQFHLPWPDNANNVSWRINLWRCSFWDFLCTYLTSSVWGQNTQLSTLFLKTFRFSFLCIRHQFHTHWTRQVKLILYVLLYTFLDRKWKYDKLRTDF